MSAGCSRKKIWKWNRNQVSDDVRGEYGGSQETIVWESAPDEQGKNNRDEPD
jgi:hypothetical protein